jgi:hypothetical protein
MDETKRVAENIVRAIEKLHKKHNVYPRQHTEALEHLSSIFKEATLDIRCEIPTQKQNSAHHVWTKTMNLMMT